MRTWKLFLTAAAVAAVSLTATVVAVAWAARKWSAADRAGVHTVAAATEAGVTTEAETPASTSERTSASQVINATAAVTGCGAVYAPTAYSLVDPAPLRDQPGFAAHQRERRRLEAVVDGMIDHGGVKAPPGWSANTAPRPYYTDAGGTAYALIVLTPRATPVDRDLVDRLRGNCQYVLMQQPAAHDRRVYVERDAIRVQGDGAQMYVTTAGTTIRRGRAVVVVVAYRDAGTAAEPPAAARLEVVRAAQGAAEKLHDLNP